MTLVSNYAFLEVLDPIPRENIGWEIHAISPADFESVVAVFPSWEDMTFSRPLNDPGVGSLVVAADEARLQLDVGGWPLEDTEVLFRVYDEGVLRFDWLAEKPTRPEDKPGLLQISGRGTACLFERGIVLPDGYPTGQATTRTFTGTRMGVWLQLLDEAQLRGTIPEVTIDFDAVADSAGVAWPLAETFDVNVGDNLLDLLSQFTELIGATWVMRPGMTLTVFMSYGNDRRDEVVWHLGGHTQEHVYERDRTSIGTVIYSGKDGNVQAASDLAAEDRWGRREKWISSGDTTDSAAIARYATRNLELLKDQKKVRTVTVPWKAPFRRVFVDWAPGDIVSVETLRDGVQAIKVIAASIKVDKDTQTTVEMTISDDPTAALPREVAVAQQSARDGSRATQTRASKAPRPVSPATVVEAGTGLSGGGPIGGGTSIAVDLEWLQDTVGAMLLSGTGVVLSYDDVLGKLGAAVDLEWLQDTVASMFVGSNISVTYDDTAGTITLAPSLEWLQDSVAGLLVAGTDITLTYNDGAGTLTIDAAGGGGGGSSRPPLDSDTLHSTYGDDFAAGSLDAKWTRRNLTSGDEAWTTTDNGWLESTIPNGGATDRQYHQAAPAGDFTIILSQVLWATADSTQTMCGPMIIDSSGNGIAATPYNDDRAYIWNLGSYVYSSTGNSQRWQNASHMCGEKHWIRLRKSGTTYYASFSRDGHRWSKEISGSWGGTVDRIGFGRMYQSGTPFQMHVDRFNVV